MEILKERRFIEREAKLLEKSNIHLERTIEDNENENYEIIRNIEK